MGLCIDLWVISTSTLPICLALIPKSNTLLLLDLDVKCLLRVILPRFQTKKNRLRIQRIH